MNNPYTFCFLPLVTARFDGIFMERLSVYSNEKKDNKDVISTCFDFLFTVEDVKTLPIDDLEIYFKEHKQELSKRLSFEEFENYSELTDEEVKECIIDSCLKNPNVLKTFLKIEEMFYGLREAEQAIINKEYDVEVIHKYEVEIEAAGEIFVLELEGEVKETAVDYFAYYVDELSNLIPFSSFLEKDVEEAFLKDVLKQTRIRRLVAPSAEE